MRYMTRRMTMTATMKVVSMTKRCPQTSNVKRSINKEEWIYLSP